MSGSQSVAELFVIVLVRIHCREQPSAIHDERQPAASIFLAPVELLLETLCEGGILAAGEQRETRTRLLPIIFQLAASRILGSIFALRIFPSLLRHPPENLLRPIVYISKGGNLPSPRATHPPRARPRGCGRVRASRSDAPPRRVSRDFHGVAAVSMVKVRHVGIIASRRPSLQAAGLPVFATGRAAQGEATLPYPNSSIRSPACLSTCAICSSVRSSRQPPGDAFRLFLPSPFSPDGRRRPTNACGLC